MEDGWVLYLSCEGYDWFRKEGDSLVSTDEKEFMTRKGSHLRDGIKKCRRQRMEAARAVGSLAITGSGSECAPYS